MPKIQRHSQPSLMMFAASEYDANLYYAVKFVSFRIPFRFSGSAEKKSS